jgi:toxin YoeB
MEVFFNELSLNPRCDTKEEAMGRIETLLGTMKELFKHDYNKLRTHNNFWSEIVGDSYSFTDFFNDDSVNRNLKTLLQSVVVNPYLVEDTEEEEDFILNSFVTENQEGIETIPEGLGSAFVYHEPSVSLDSHDAWRRTPLLLKVTPDAEDTSSTIEIQNFWNKESVEVWEQLQEENIELNSVENIEKVFPPEKYLFEERALNELLDWYYDDSRYQEKIKALIFDIDKNPFVGGLGLTEVLKGTSGRASKKIVKKDRITYTYTKELITIHQCKGHYDDK